MQVTQVFFSLSITFGIMTAYGSHCRRDEPAFKNAIIIAVSDSLYSFISGFAVFGKFARRLSTTEDIRICLQLHSSTTPLLSLSYCIVATLGYMAFLEGVDIQDL
jgi:SNF family Na+-dependent transporter